MGQIPIGFSGIKRKHVTLKISIAEQPKLWSGLWWSADTTFSGARPRPDYYRTPTRGSTITSTEGGRRHPSLPTLSGHVHRVIRELSCQHAHLDKRCPYVFVFKHKQLLVSG